MLLTEYRPFTLDNNLVESARRSIKENTPLVIEGVIQRAEAQNQNGRVYPRAILEREVEKYLKGPVAERRALGELDHPDSEVVNLNNVSHLITDVWWEGNDVMGKIEVLNTPSGRILKELFAQNITVGISSRGMGSVQESEGQVTVQDDFELLCWDMVSNPSTQGAFVRPKSLNEGLNSNPKFIYEEVNNIIRDIICDNTGMCKC